MVVVVGQGGGEDSNHKTPLWEGCGYFLEQQIVSIAFVKLTANDTLFKVIQIQYIMYEQ